VGCFKVNQPLTDREPFHATSCIRPTSTLVVNAEPLSNWPGPMCSQPPPLHGLQIHPVPVVQIITYCKQLSRSEISLAICQLHLWLMRRLLPGCGVYYTLNLFLSVYSACQARPSHQPKASLADRQRNSYLDNCSQYMMICTTGTGWI